MYATIPLNVDEHLIWEEPELSTKTKSKLVIEIERNSETITKTKF